MWKWLNKSWTVTCAATVNVVGAGLDTIAQVPDLMPDFKQNIADIMGGADLQTVARVSMAVSTLLLIARLRSIRNTYRDNP